MLNAYAFSQSKFIVIERNSWIRGEFGWRSVMGVEVNRAVSFDGALGCKLETYTLEALAFHQASEGILSNFYGTISSGG